MPRPTERGTTRGPLRGRSARAAGNASDEAAGAVERLAMLLEAGVSPDSAWRYLGEFSDHPVVTSVARAVARGARPVDALARSPAVGEPDGDAWRSLGAAWAVSDACGAPLAPSLRHLAEALRARAETERDIDVGLTGPVATSRLVGWLPVAGFALGLLMGVDVVGALSGSPIGWLLLGGGAALTVTGRMWTRSLIRRATPRSATAGLSLDLVAVALTGGVSVARAQAVVGEASARFGIGDSATQVAGILALSARAGAPAVDLLRSSARQERRDARIDGQRAAAALAVRLMLPLGVCVLPAFMLLGVAPVVLTIVSSTVGSL